MGKKKRKQERHFEFRNYLSVIIVATIKSGGKFADSVFGNLNEEINEEMNQVKDMESQERTKLSKYWRRRIQLQ